MDLVYGPATDTKLPTTANWLTTSRRTGPLGGEYVRSNRLQQIDAALRNFHQTPTRGNLTALATRNQAWRQSKTNDQGNVRTRRLADANTLDARITAYQTFMADRATLMGNVRNLIDGTLIGGLTWKELYLAAELYDVQNGDQPPWTAIGDTNVQALAFESRMSSGWAMHTPDTVAEWSQHGATELAQAGTWPAVPLKVRVQLGRIGLTSEQWPPWTTGENGASVHAFLRKGLFCHTSAALAAHFLDANRLVLEAGLTCRIRTISVIHQQPAHQGGMSHWWVCVNKPDRIELGVRQHTFNNFADFAALPMCGGFVVDIWGALWNDQDPANAPARAASNLATAGDCVWDEPGDYLGNTGTIARAHFQYF